MNGVDHPTICINQNEWTRLRFQFAGAVFPIDLSIESANCEVKLLARDGVLIHGEDNTVPRDIHFVHLQVAGRSDVAVRCSNPGTFKFVFRYFQMKIHEKFITFL